MMTDSWREVGGDILVEAWYEEGGNPWVDAIKGQITVSMLVQLEKDMIDIQGDLFTLGNGLYVFSCTYIFGEKDSYGGVLTLDYWEFNLEFKDDFEWECQQ